MIYLTGCHRLSAAEAGLGILAQPGNSNYLKADEYRTWAADNGCFSSKPFDFDRWMQRLIWRAWSRRGNCLFATAPDVVADAVGTYERGWTLLYRLRTHGLRAAFVAQDGLETAQFRYQGDGPTVRRQGFWDELDCLFIGGSTSWKLGPAAEWLTGEAKARRKWVHMGRVNSRERFLYAASIGCDSADGNYIGYRARNGGGDRGVHEVLSWIRDAQAGTQVRLLPQEAA